MKSLKKPIYIRAMYDYEKYSKVLEYLQEITIKTPHGMNDMFWDFSNDKYAYEYSVELIQQEQKYLQKKLNEYRKKNPEEFL